MHKRKHPIFVSKTAFFNSLIILGVVVFVSIAAITGKLISDSIMPYIIDVDSYQPVEGEEQPTDPSVAAPDDGNDEETGSDSQVKSVNIEVQNQEYYLVQMGVYQTEQNAQTSAESVSTLGGAGYVRENLGKYYVYAMCYSNQSDAEQVVEQLKAQGFTGLVSSVSHQGLKMTVKGSDEKVSEIKATFERIPELLSQIESLAFSYDKGEIDITTAKTELQSIAGVAAECKDAMADSEKGAELFSASVELFSSIYDDACDLMKSSSASTISSDIKYFYVKTVFDVKDFLDNAVQ